MLPALARGTFTGDVEKIMKLGNTRMFFDLPSLLKRFGLSVFFNQSHPPSQRLRFESFSEGLFDSGREKIVGFQT
jgi:hypothetical protein